MAKRQIPKRASNPKRIARRAASWKRGQERKEARKKAQKTAEARNKALRAEGELTPYEARKEAYRARRAERIAREKAAGTYRPNKFNERGFIVESVDGHVTLRDPDNWHKRKHSRYALIKSGLVKTSEDRMVIITHTR